MTIRPNEALVVVHGEASIRLGGEGGAPHEGRIGDAMPLPAGFGHHRARASADLTVVGG